MTEQIYEKWLDLGTKILHCQKQNANMWKTKPGKMTIGK